MGQDKALLPMGKNTLLDFTHHKLEATQLFDEIVVCRNQQNHSDNFTFLPDIQTGLGPIGALHTLSVHYSSHCVLVVPVDMPLLQQELIEELCESGLQLLSAAHFEGYHFPLLIFLDDTTIFHLAKRLIQDVDDLSIASLLRDIDAHQLAPPKDKSPFINLNNQEEWRGFVGNLDSIKTC